MRFLLLLLAFVSPAFGHGLEPGQGPEFLDPARPVIVFERPHHKGGGVFVLHGKVYRLYGIDLPETDMAECTAEAQAGWRAVERLKQIWTEGAIFEPLQNSDVHDRQWGQMILNGKNVTTILLEEKFGREWTGPRSPRMSWCLPPRIHGVVP